MIIHIGKKVPKEFEELAGSIHLGKGIWAFNVRLKEKKKRAQRRKKI